MKITQTTTETILDGSGELVFTKNNAAMNIDPSVTNLNVSNFHYRAYYGGFWNRIKCCWHLWEWLGETR